MERPGRYENAGGEPNIWVRVYREDKQFPAKIYGSE